MKSYVLALGVLATIAYTCSAHAEDVAAPVAVKQPKDAVNAKSTAPTPNPAQPKANLPEPAAKPIPGNHAVGQLIAVDPTTIKIKDWKGGQEWSLSIGSANIKSFKVGDKVTCTFDGATKMVKTIELTK